MKQQRQHLWRVGKMTVLF